MAKCYYCPETATQNCGICFTPVCDRHKHPVSRWHNPYHASWICQSCYQQKERKRIFVLVPVVAAFAVLIAASMKVQWGLAEPGMWAYFSALAAVLVVVLAAGTLYKLFTRSSEIKVWIYRLLAAALLWTVLFLAYRILSN